jgi:CHASE3 domain sensor protein
LDESLWIARRNIMGDLKYKNMIQKRLEELKLEIPAMEIRIKDEEDDLEEIEMAVGSDMGKKMFADSIAVLRNHLDENKKVLKAAREQETLFKKLLENWDKLSEEQKRFLDDFRPPGYIH